MSQFTSNVLGKFIENTIATYEPRAKVVAVEVVPQEEQNSYVVTIVYMLINRTDPITINVTLQRVR
jgi:predicted component of type VI protein secretion system